MQPNCFFLSSVEVMFLPPRHVCTVCRIVPSGNRQRTKVSRHPGVKASRRQGHEHAKTPRRAQAELNRLRRAAHCSVPSPVTPFYVLSRISCRLIFSLNNFLLFLLSPPYSPCSSLLLMLSGDGAVYDFTILIFHCTSFATDSR